MSNDCGASASSHGMSSSNEITTELPDWTVFRLFEQAGGVSTRIFALAGADVSPPAVAVKVNVSRPTKPAFGVYVIVPASKFGVTVPCCGVAENPVNASPSGSEHGLDVSEWPGKVAAV